MAAATLEGLAANVARARAVVGSAPALENVATLVEPPGSECDEPAWLPYEMVHTNYTLPFPSGSGCFIDHSNGLASGNTQPEYFAVESGTAAPAA